MSFEIDDEGDLIWKNEKGQWHREEGPAILGSEGHIVYRFNNEFHRPDGPAFIYPNGSKRYYIYGTAYTKEEYYSKVKEL